MKTRHLLQTRGFSLVELLLALLVVAVLIGLLWPALAESRQRALSAKCISNLRQVGAALLSYSADHKGYILTHIEKDPTDKGIAGTFWHQVLRKKGYMASAADESTSAGRIMAQKKGVHACPLLPSSGGAEESYGLRRWRTPGEKLFDTTKNLFVLENRADFFLATDSYRPADNAQGYFVGPDSTAYRIHLKHGGLANTLFADGHIAAMGKDYFADLHVRQKAYQNGNPFYFWPEPLL